MAPPRICFSILKKCKKSSHRISKNETFCLIRQVGQNWPSKSGSRQALRRAYVGRHLVQEDTRSGVVLRQKRSGLSIATCILKKFISLFGFLSCCWPVAFSHFVFCCAGRNCLREKGRCVNSRISNESRNKRTSGEESVRIGCRGEESFERWQFVRHHVNSERLA